jgi:Ca2+-binding RTX toxin-like protein
VIRGGPGNDVIHGTAGADTIIDTFVEGGFSVVCARAGNDRIEVSGPPGLAISAHIDAGAGNDTITVVGSASVVGSDGDDQIDALSPPESSGQGTSVVLDGGPGTDTIEWQGGSNSRILGGTGNDHIRVRSGIVSFSTVDFSVEGGPGNDTIDAEDGFSMSVLGGDGNDRISMGHAEGGLIDGGPGNDVVAVNDVEFQDIRGGDGNDQLTVTAIDFAVLSGGAGDDVIDLSFGGESPVIDGGPGNDVITAGPGRGSRYIVAGGGGNDEITATGNQLDGRLLGGGNGNDFLVSTSAADTLDGGPASDVCRSAPGSVVINCEAS